jgi:hypothetical protein
MVMRTRPEDGKGIAKKWSEDEATSRKSWTSLISIGLWEEIVDRISLCSEYPKGTQTSPRHVTYSSHLNKMAETIRLASKGRFRTETELFRVAIHIGMSVLYFIFCLLPHDSKKQARGHMFYEALIDLEKKMERASLVVIAKEKLDGLMEYVKKDAMPAEEAMDEMNKFLLTVNEEDAEYIRTIVLGKRQDNVKMMNQELRKKIMGCK